MCSQALLSHPYHYTILSYNVTPSYLTLRAYIYVLSTLSSQLSIFSLNLSQPISLLFSLPHLIKISTHLSV